MYIFNVTTVKSRLVIANNIRSSRGWLFVTITPYIFILSVSELNVFLVQVSDRSDICVAQRS